MRVELALHCIHKPFELYSLSCLVGQSIETFRTSPRVWIENLAAEAAAAASELQTLGQCGHVFVSHWHSVGEQKVLRSYQRKADFFLNGRIHFQDTNHFYADLYFIDETRFSVSFSLSAQASPWFHKSFVWRTTIFWWQAIFFILLLKTDRLENYSCPTVEKRR